MTNQEMIAFKNSLKKAGELQITERIAMTKAAIDNAQAAANGEEKSSAGDKYETGRAMGHLEKDMYSRQQAENIKDLDQLQKIHVNVLYTKAQAGAFVRCAEHSFFIGTGLGKQEVDGQLVFFLSPQAPLAKLLLNKGVGEKFLFNKKETVILEVY
ncbi:hypothetical protein [Chitinophaga pinensis]|uniref:3-oxoacyl-ACP synthase n=1 Tax=Chitinophaga pinensis (strain ATCC 43595 / DSM 2588 / LMG 13176 / NBRC 15968 / NCIMB 11800 / UQM 2034) TaxID=485918 RepID=A0A979GZ91_CHIPD|nr:hypothetical protein [Chitinophaga pinensis]ACU63756.1 conserved hypothetical protein [Chitinophaga pinensis DSM 2588]